MARIVSKGTCSLCGKPFAKAGMARHLQRCLEQQAAEASKGKTKQGPLLLIRIQGRNQPEYWLFVAAAATTLLGHVDDFLRHIWLECCGHMSAFAIGETQYTGSPMDDDRDFFVALGKVLRPGMSCRYGYDFGSTTELEVKTIAVLEGPLPDKNEIRLLARNDPPVIPCAVCARPAVQVCTQCLWDGAGWLCAECAPEHECGEEMCLPVVNSPRVGVCAYTGED